MYVVTGAAGFIGGRIAAALHARGDDVLEVDLEGRAAMSHEELLRSLRRNEVNASAVIHMGAITNTQCLDRAQLWRLNFEYTSNLMKLCVQRGTRLVYASSAAVYGTSPRFVEEECAERPLNVYAESKLAIDQVVRRQRPPDVLGLRFFNVYGPGEAHKGRMASIVLQAFRSLTRDGLVRLFDGSHGFPPGGHRRDFVHVQDVVSVVLWAAEHRVDGILNVGTGTAATFQEVAELIIERLGGGHISHIKMPQDLRARYQPHTCAVLVRLRAAGYLHPFRSIQDGVGSYVDFLRTQCGPTSLQGKSCCHTS